MVLTLKRRLTETLEEAGFSSREAHLPVYDRGGCFEIITGPAGAEVRVAWWDSGDWERRELLEAFAAVLREAGLSVEDRDQALYVAGE